MPPPLLSLPPKEPVDDNLINRKAWPRVLKMGASKLDLPEGTTKAQARQAKRRVDAAMPVASR